MTAELLTQTLQMPVQFEKITCGHACRCKHHLVINMFGLRPQPRNTKAPENTQHMCIDYKGAATNITEVQRRSRRLALHTRIFLKLPQSFRSWQLRNMTKTDLAIFILVILPRELQPGRFFFGKSYAPDKGMNLTYGSRGCQIPITMVMQRKPIECASRDIISRSAAQY